MCKRQLASSHLMREENFAWVKARGKRYVNDVSFESEKKI